MFYLKFFVDVQINIRQLLISIDKYARKIKYISENLNTRTIGCSQAWLFAIK